MARAVRSCAATHYREGTAIVIRVGIAGLGGMGNMHAHCYAALPNRTIIAGADLKPEGRERFARGGCA